MIRRIQINLAVFVLIFFAFLWWAVQNIVTIDAIERPYSLSGDFEAAAGILPDAEVSYIGVRYGRVDSVDLTDGGVRIDMKIDRGSEIPKGSTFSVFRKSAVGEPYILVTPPSGTSATSPVYASGDHIPLEQTTTPLEFSDLLRSAARLVESIEPEEVGELVHGLSQALAGRADDLRSLATAGDTLAASFASRTEALDRLATNNTRLTHTFAESASDIEGSLANLRAVARSLRNSRGDLVNVLEDGTNAIGRAADLVADNKQNLDCILSDLESVLLVANRDANLAGLAQVLSEAPAAFGGLWMTRDNEEDGVWVRVATLVNPENPPTQYIPPRGLPPVATVEPCSSDLLPVSFGEFTPVTPSGGSLPATGGSLALVVGLVLTGAAVTLRSVTGASRPR